mmetsp:Transcript_36565/g.64084  ORF Transcript_36565/g.64084 Transcript_36565/m.64084 type:complete len:409 (-) Transcript_36565:199-1425(-)
MYHPFRGATSTFEKKEKMPNVVAEELAALRNRGSVKARATHLQGGAAISTPEAEAAALKAQLEHEKLGNTTAKKFLNKGSKGAAQASADQAAQFTAKKKEDLEKKAQATEMLSKGGSGYSQEMEHALSQTGKKKADWEKKNETKRAMASSSSGSPPKSVKAVPQAVMADKKSAETVAVETESSVAKEEPAAAPVETADDVPEVEVEEVDDEIPELETPQTENETQQPEGAEEEEERQITNRNEKKARKMMTRLGMRPVSNIARVTLKAGPGRGYFFIDRPDVYMSVGGKADTYVIFGEAKQGGNGGFGNAAQAAQAQAAMAQQQAAMAAANATGGDKGKMMPSVQEDDEDDVPELTNKEGGNAGDEEGVEVKDIDLIMSQASCSRAKAVAALKENDGDLVNAIMSLTT